MNKRFNLINYCEIDKYASTSYCAIHNVDKSLNLEDITKVDTSLLPNDIDLVTYGFPCQDISLAGKQKGFEHEGKRTRSGLFFEALRIIEDKKPKVAIAENVKNLTSKRFKKEFDIVLKSLEEAGYNNYWKVLNAKNYGIPQNRERVFIVSIRKDIDNEMFEFPKPFKLELKLKDMLEDEVDEKYYLSEKMIAYISSQGTKNFKNCDCRINLDIARPLTTAHGKRAGTTNYISNDLLENYDLRELDNKEFLMIREATKKGYAEAKDGDGVYINRPHQKRDVVQNGMIQTLKTSGNDVGVVVSNPKIMKYDIPQTVKVRKYEVDTDKLVNVLRGAKCDVGLTNKDIADKLDIPLTKVEHWFRKDNSFAIPNCEIWFKLKELLGIETDEFDESITTFEEREGVYEKSNRCYHEDGVSPTLTSVSADEKIITDLRIRKLTPLECYRLMGFDDKDFYKAKRSLNETHYKAKDRSSTQLYKQAGNSIVVNVLYELFKKLYTSIPDVFNDLQLLSLFSGIGAPEKALDRLYKNVINK